MRIKRVKTSRYGNLLIRGNGYLIFRNGNKNGRDDQRVGCGSKTAGAFVLDTRSRNFTINSFGLRIDSTWTYLFSAKSFVDLPLPY